MSNVLTDFISLPGATSSSTITSPISPANAGIKNRSQSLIGKVRRGTLFRPSLSQRRRTETFDLVEQKVVVGSDKDQGLSNDPRNKSCLKIKITKGSRGKSQTIFTPTRNVSFDARAADSEQGK